MASASAPKVVSTPADNTAKVVVVPKDYTGVPKVTGPRGAASSSGGAAKIPVWDNLTKDQKKALATAATVLLGATAVVAGVAAFKRHQDTAKVEVDVHGVAGLKKGASNLKSKATHALHLDGGHKAEAKVKGAARDAEGKVEGAWENIKSTLDKGARKVFAPHPLRTLILKTKANASAARDNVAGAAGDAKASAKSGWFGLKRNTSNAAYDAKAKADHATSAAKAKADQAAHDAKVKADKAADAAAHKAQEAHDALARKAAEANEASKHAARNTAASGGGVLEAVGRKVKHAGEAVEGKGHATKAHWEKEEAKANAKGCTIM